jgi:MoaA/NifB/PqqE/SkfB family radical SAM enzyme
LRKDLVRFIEYARKAGILDIYFSTNGALLTEEVSRSLIESGLLRLQVSINASTKATYDKIRIGGDFDMIKGNIERLLQMRYELGRHLPTVRVNFVKTPVNTHELQEFLDYWEPKVDGVGIQDLVDILGDHGKHTPDASGMIFNCNQPFNHLTIRYDGTILPCCSFFGAEIPIARLKSSVPFSDVENMGLLEKDRKARLPILTIEEAWHSDEMKFFREIHRNGEYWRHPVCNKCVLSSSHLA